MWSVSMCILSQSCFVSIKFGKRTPGGLKYFVMCCRFNTFYGVGRRQILYKAMLIAFLKHRDKIDCTIYLAFIQEVA